MNIGQMPRLRILYGAHPLALNISGGPLRPYKYRFQRIDFHYSNDETAGSEHAINSKSFPMEVLFFLFRFLQATVRLKIWDSPKN